MAKVDSNQSHLVNKPTATKYSPGSAIKGCNYNLNTIQKNTTHEHYWTNHFEILHQNVHGLSHKFDEFLLPLLPNSPQIICLTEHHLRNVERANVNLDQYTLGAQFCRQTYKQDGVCIYVSNDIQFSTIKLEEHNREKDLEICTLKMRILSYSFVIICIYRSSLGNFDYFLNQLESILT